MPDLVLPTTRERTILASAARTTAQTGADIETANSRGIIVYLNVTVASGTGGLSVIIEGKDALSGAYIALNAAPAAVITTGLKAYLVYPDTASGGVTQATAGVWPGRGRVRVTVGDATSYTYSLAAVLLA